MAPLPPSRRLPPSSRPLRRIVSSASTAPPGNVSPVRCRRLSYFEATISHSRLHNRARPEEGGAAHHAHRHRLPPPLRRGLQPRRRATRRCCPHCPPRLSARLHNRARSRQSCRRQQRRCSSRCGCRRGHWRDRGRHCGGRRSRRGEHRRGGDCSCWCGAASRRLESESKSKWINQTQFGFGFAFRF